MIHITNGQSDEIIDFITENNFFSDTHRQSLKDNLETFEFTTFADKSFSEYLTKRNRVIIPAEDRGYIELIINEVLKYRDSSGLKAEVFADASYLELKKAKVMDPQSLRGQTATTLVSHTTNGTEWRPGIIEGKGIRTMHIEKHTNPYAFLKRIATEFDRELRFRVETNGNQVTGHYVDLLERIGIWRGREVEFGKDLIGIQRREKSDNVYTALKGLGPERDDGTRLEVIVTDEKALQRWGRPDPITGELQHLWDTYEPQSTDQDMTKDRLRTLTENELEKRVNEVIEYGSTIADLENVPGMENKKIRFGDTLRIKDTEFNPPLYLEARVHTQDRSIKDKSQKKVVLGDYIEYTEEQVQAIWQSMQAEIRRRLARMLMTNVASSAGDTFKNGKGSTELTAEVFLSGTMVDEAGENYVYVWNKRDKNGIPVTGWNKSGKTITITADEIDEKATYTVDVIQDTVLSIGRITITNVYDGQDGKQGPEGPIGPNEINDNTDFADKFKTVGNNFYYHSALNAKGWYRIAMNAGNRAFAKFILVDKTSSNHQTVTFEAVVNYNNRPKITVSSSSRYSSGVPFSKARILTGSTYDDTFLEIYIDSSRFPTNSEIYITENIQSSGWVGLDWQPGSVPENYSIYEVSIDLGSTSSDKADNAYERAENAEDNAIGHADVVSEAAYLDAIADAEAYLAANGLIKGREYNGVSITNEDGFVTTRGDGLVRTVSNSTLGYVIQRRSSTSSPWHNILYFNTNGNIKYAGELEGATGTFKGAVEASDFTAKDGDFFLEDNETGMKYTATPKRNIVKDHSFELVKHDPDSMDSTSIKYNWLEMRESGYHGENIWMKTGSPKVAMVFGPDNRSALPIFGEKAICVRDANFVRQVLYDGIAGGMTFTASGSFKRQHNVVAGGKPRFEIDHLDAAGGFIRRLSNTIFPAVPNDYSEVRHSLTFTVPTDFAEGDSLDFKISGGNNEWVQCDGIQIVEGTSPSVYMPEDSTWEIAKGSYNAIGRQPTLWAGNAHLRADDTIYPAKPITDCRTGWIFVWGYWSINNGDVGNSDWQLTHIPKQPDLYNGGGHRTGLRAGSDNLDVVKYYYIHHDRVVGHDLSYRGDNRYIVLREILEY